MDDYVYAQLFPFRIFLPFIYAGFDLSFAWFDLNNISNISDWFRV